MKVEIQKIKLMMIGKLYIKMPHSKFGTISLEEAVNIIEEFQMEIETIIERGIKS